MTTLIRNGDDWLKEENPDLYAILKSLDGDRASLGRLRLASPALYQLARVLAGEKAALADLRELEDLELEYLQGAVLNCSQVSWLAERSAELALFFEALQGQEASLKRLKRKKASLARLAVQVGEILKRLASDPDKQGGEDKDDKGQVLYTEGATADVGLLVGEEHLRQHEYARAVEAFTRSLRTNPSADAYEGRARAYHALALADEARARALRDYDERGPSAP